MKRNHFLLSLLSGIFLLSGYFSTAQAGTYEASDDYGLFIGISGGYGDTHWDDFFIPVNSDNFAMRGTVGYQFTEYYSYEFGFTYFFETNDIETWVLDLSSRLAVPVWDNVSVFAKYGINYMKSEHNINRGGSRDTYNATFGAGLMYTYNNDFVIEASWQRFGGEQEINDFQPFADYFSIGVIYKLSGLFSGYDS